MNLLFSLLHQRVNDHGEEGNDEKNYDHDDSDEPFRKM